MLWSFLFAGYLRYFFLRFNRTQTVNASPWERERDSEKQSETERDQENKQANKQKMGQQKFCKEYKTRSDLNTQVIF